MRGAWLLALAGPLVLTWAVEPKESSSKANHAISSGPALVQEDEQHLVHGHAEEWERLEAARHHGRHHKRRRSWRERLAALERPAFARVNDAVADHVHAHRTEAVQRRAEVRKARSASADAGEGGGIANAQKLVGNTETNEETLAASKAAEWSAKMAMDLATKALSGSKMTSKDAAAARHDADTATRRVRDAEDKIESMRDDRLKDEAEKAEADSQDALVASREAESRAKMAMDTAAKALRGGESTSKIAADARHNAEAAAARADDALVRVENVEHNLQTSGAPERDPAAFTGALRKVKDQEAELQKAEHALALEEARDEKLVFSLSANQTHLAETLKETPLGHVRANIGQENAAMNTSVRQLGNRARGLEQQEDGLVRRLAALRSSVEAAAGTATEVASQQTALRAGQKAVNASLKDTVSLVLGIQKQNDAQKRTLGSVVKTISSLSKATGELEKRALAVDTSESSLGAAVRDLVRNTAELQEGQKRLQNDQRKVMRPSTSTAGGVVRLEEQIKALGAEQDAVQKSLAAMGKNHEVLWGQEKDMEAREAMKEEKIKTLFDLEEVLEKKQALLSADEDRQRTAVVQDHRRLLALIVTVGVGSALLCLLAVSRFCSAAVWGGQKAGRDDCA